MTAPNSFCRKCGTPKEPDDLFCGSCGQTFAGVKSPAFAQDKIPSRPARAGTNVRRITIMVVIAAALVIAGIALVSYLEDEYFVSAEGMYQRGKAYLEGGYVVRNFTEAVKWLKRAAESGNAGAMDRLAFCYETGKGVPRDEQQAIAWYTRAAESGLADAQAHLGWMHFSGAGVPKDISKGIEMCSEIANQGSAEAQYVLGLMYMNRFENLLGDQMAAIEWFQKAARQEHAKAQDELRKLKLNW